MLGAKPLCSSPAAISDPISQMYICELCVRVTYHLTTSLSAGEMKFHIERGGNVIWRFGLSSAVYHIHQSKLTNILAVLLIINIFSHPLRVLFSCALCRHYRARNTFPIMHFYAISHRFGALYRFWKFVTATWKYCVAQKYTRISEMHSVSLFTHKLNG